MKAKILVSFKESVLDPQGQTVMNALHTMGYRQIVDVRQGKVFDVELKDVHSSREAEKILKEIADKVLANPIIEKFVIQPETPKGETGGRRPAKRAKTAKTAKKSRTVKKPRRTPKADKTKTAKTSKRGRP